MLYIYITMSYTTKSIRYIINLPEHLSRRAIAHIDDPNTPYTSLDDLVSIAIRNQLSLDLDFGTSQKIDSNGEMHHNLYDSRRLDNPLILRASLDNIKLANPSTKLHPLSFLTNRLNPFSIVVRIVANLHQPNPKTFIKEATRVAHEVGLYLRSLDRSAGLKRDKWRSVSWPVGTDVNRTMEKFRVSYLIDDSGNGPLFNLGLANIIDEESICLTPLGKELAQAPSPLLGEDSEGWTLSQNAKSVLQACVLQNKHECSSIRTFLKAVENHDGIQAKIDKDLGTSESNWTNAHVVSHRAAMIGRLHDIDVISVKGRGPNAVINIELNAKEFVQQILEGN